jgi:vancomycin resistance protein YoaR
MNTIRFLLLLMLLGVAALVWSAALYETSHADRIYDGVRAFNVDLSGMTRDEASAALRSRLNPTQRVALRDGVQVYSLSLAELGISLDDTSVLDAAFSIGRGGGWFDNLQEQAITRLDGQSLSTSLVMDDGMAQVALTRLARRFERMPRDASVALIGSQVLSEPAVIGRALDVNETIDRLKGSIGQTDAEGVDVQLAIHDVQPVVLDAGDGVAQMRAMLSVPLRLTMSDRAWVETGRSAAGLQLVSSQQDRSWLLDTATLATMLNVKQVSGSGGQATLSVSLDEAKLTDFLKGIAAQINRPARDARFYYDESSRTLTPLIASQEGRTLDVAATLLRIEAQVASDNRLVPLVVKTTKPTIALEDMDKFNIHELVVAGTTSFKGSSPERIINVTRAMHQFDGVMVAPGQQFSFNEYLGDVLDANGYEPAWVIIGDRTDVGIGGGVCQVSTTAFRAAFYGGYDIAERWAHGYTVHYYEPPVGMDATVFAPAVDFKFVNDTPNYLLIQPTIDLKKLTLTFSFYGTKNKRTVEMDGPTVTKVIPHPPDVREEDPTLPAGVVKQVDFSADGMTVVVNRVVKDGDKVVHRDRFVSTYRPWTARFLVGTKRA